MVNCNFQINRKERNQRLTAFVKLLPKEDRKSITHSTFSVTSLFTLLPLVYKLSAGLMAAGNVLIMLHYLKDFLNHDTCLD